MEYFDNKFKSILQPDKSDLPEGLSWDEMKEGINDKLDGADKIKIKKNRKGLWLTLTIITLFILLISITKCLDTRPANQNKSLDNKEDFVLDTKKIRNSEIAVAKNINKTADQTEAQNPQNVASQKNAIASGVRPQAIIGENQQKKTFTDFQNGPFEQKVVQKEEKESIHKNEVDNRMARIKSEFPLLDKPGFSLQHAAEMKSLSSRISKITQNKKQYKNHSSYSYTLAMTGGLNVFFGKYKAQNELADLRNPALYPILGQMGGLSINRTKNDKWGMTASLSYARVHQMFDITFDKAATVLLEDALINVDTNVITRRKTYTHIDTLVNTIERRHVINYNQFQLLSFDLQVSRKWSLNPKWTMESSIGVRYTRMFQLQARMIDQDLNIIDIAKENSIYKKNHLGFVTAVGINYRINDAISIGKDIFMHQYLNNWSLEDGMKLRPSYFSLQFSVKYRF